MITSTLNIDSIRKQFPILNEIVYGKPLVYLDNAATTQKPLSVLKVMEDYYHCYNSNVHRGVHHLSQIATDAFEEARRKVTSFINAAHDHEVIFTKGTTNSINIVAQSFGKRFINEGDEVIITAMEHHSNIVPWQMICDERKAKLKVAPINADGELLMDELENMLNENVKILSVTYVSNTLGTINPVKEIIAKAHALNIPVLVDCAQAIQHMPIDVQDMDADFIAFSSHKMFGPTGIGVLYGKEHWLNQMPPVEGGGEMIKTVSFEKSTYNHLPFKFEAGTPDMCGAIGLGAAIDFINEIGIDNIHDAEASLMKYALQKLSQIEGLRFIGNAKNRSGAISFLVNDIHPFDLGELLDKQGIAVRTGHHCTQPLMNIFKIPGTVRASFAFYNTKEEVDILVAGIERAKKMF